MLWSTRQDSTWKTKGGEASDPRGKKEPFET